MVMKICLVCGGFKKCLYYCIVVVDICVLCDGCFIEKVGFYNLMLLKDFEECVQLNVEWIQYWFGNGVQLIDCVYCFFDVVGFLKCELCNNLKKVQFGCKVQECLDEKKVVEEEVVVVVVEEVVVE